MKIILDGLKIRSFKGIKTLDMKFPHTYSTLSGKNGTCKTTVFDSLQWVLFGKDSLDRQQFSVKPLDIEGKTSDHVEVDVEADLRVFEEEDSHYKLVLRKTMTEIWKKPRGQEQKVFSGHETTYFINGVPHTMKDYDKRISELCSEALFRLITNPRYFPNLNWKVQRESLVELVGGYATDERILESHPEFTKLFEQLIGKTMEGLRKEIANNIRRIKEELEGIPFRIDELFKSLPENKFADSITYPGRIETLDKEISDLNAKKGSKDKLVTEVNQERFRIQNEINRIAIRNQEIELLVEQDLKSGKANTEQDLVNLKARKELLKTSVHDIEDSIIRKTTLRNDLQASKDALVKEWLSIKGEVFVVNNSDTVCPTCQRAWDEDYMAQKREEMERKFNENKMNRIQINVEKGKKKNAEIEVMNTSIQDLERSKNETLGKITLLETQIISEEQTRKDLAVIDYKQLTRQILRREVMSKDDKVKAWVAEYDSNIAQAELQRQRMPEEVSADTQDDKEAMAKIDEEISQKTTTRDKYKEALVIVAKIEETTKRIEFLKGQQIILNQELTSLEEYQMLFTKYDRVKISMLEDSINALFVPVKFKMFNTLINGTIEETCECTFNGVPYSDLNNAARINVGLTIINGISNVHNIKAPIFIDNSEAVNEVRKMDTQLILLRVTDHDKLTLIV